MGPSVLNAYFNRFLKVVGHNINCKVLGGEGPKEIWQTSGFFSWFLRLGIYCKKHCKRIAKADQYHSVMSPSWMSQKIVNHSITHVVIQQKLSLSFHTSYRDIYETSSCREDITWFNTPTFNSGGLNVTQVWTTRRRTAKSLSKLFTQSVFLCIYSE